MMNPTKCMQLRCWQKLLLLLCIISVLGCYLGLTNSGFTLLTAGLIQVGFVDMSHSLFDDGKICLEGIPPPKGSIPNVSYHAGHMPSVTATSLYHGQGHRTPQKSKSPEHPTKQVSANMDKELRSDDLFQRDVTEIQNLLAPNLIPNTLFYIFCQQEVLLFNHYIAILSAVRHIHPENVVFYHDWTEPRNSKPFYNTFYEELKTEFSFFRSIRIKSSVACDGPMRPKISFIYCLLSAHGGWYIHETSIITDYRLLSMRNYSLIDALDPDTGRGFILAQPGLDLDVHDHQLTMLKTKVKSKTMECFSNQTYIDAPANSKPVCINLLHNFWPKDIMTLENDFGELARRIFYKKPGLAVPKPNFNDLIPNIAHMIWIGGGHMDFLFYLGVLSLIYVGEVEHVYIHGDFPPTGEYWDRVKHHPKVMWIYRKLPGSVYGQPVHVVAHISDVWRADFMIRYGGIYMDTDAVMVRKLTRGLRAYDAIASFDWPQWNRPFPDTINLGFTAGKRSGEFWHLFQNSFISYKDNDWSYNGISKPYQIWERHPDLLKIEAHLQVMCYYSKCHPTWVADYHNADNNHVTSNSIRDFKHDAFAFHWTWPTPPELKEEKILRITNHTLSGKIGNYILRRAGLHNKQRETITIP